jgi:hypothetical protein
MKDTSEKKSCCKSGKKKKKDCCKTKKVAENQNDPAVLDIAEIIAQAIK